MRRISTLALLDVVANALSKDRIWAVGIVRNENTSSFASNTMDSVGRIVYWSVLVSA
jgi:hypothetical protein